MACPRRSIRCAVPWIPARNLSKVWPAQPANCCSSRSLMSRAVRGHGDQRVAERAHREGLLEGDRVRIGGMCCVEAGWPDAALIHERDPGAARCRGWRRVQNPRSGRRREPRPQVRVHWSTGRRSRRSRCSPRTARLRHTRRRACASASPSSTTDRDAPGEPGASAAGWLTRTFSVVTRVTRPVLSPMPRSMFVSR